MLSMVVMAYNLLMFFECFVGWMGTYSVQTPGMTLELF